MSASISASRQPWRSAGARKWRPPGGSAGRRLLSFGGSDKSFALGLLARELAGSPDRFSLFTVRSFGRFLVKSSALHLAKNAFALHFLLEYPQSLVDVVVADEDLQETFPSLVESREELPRHDRRNRSVGRLRITAFMQGNRLQRERLVDCGPIYFSHKLCASRHGIDHAPGQSE